MSKPKLFDYLNDINQKNGNLLRTDPENVKGFQPFMVLKGLSYYPDTIFWANELNKYNELPKLVQYDFLYDNIRKKKRFSKWFKKDINSDVLAVQKFYNLSEVKAEEYLQILTPDQLEYIKSQLDEGGKK